MSYFLYKIDTNIYIGSKTFYTASIDTFVESQCKPNYLTKKAWKLIPTKYGIFNFSGLFSLKRYLCQNRWISIFNDRLSNLIFVEVISDRVPKRNV